MAAEENRIANLKTLVDRLASESGGKLRQGYRAVATATGLDEEYIYQLYKGIKKSMGPDAAKSIARAYADGRPPGWFDLPLEAEISSDGQETAVVASGISPAPQPGQAVVHVPLLANAGSMGPGTDIQHDDILVGQIALSEQWVARRLQPTNLNALRFIHAYGDSMSPTFEDGDILLVDTGIKDPKIIDGVYVMAANDRVYIKRVRQRMDGVVEISSDNATVKTVDVLNGDHRIDILGRVVWCWNGRKL